MRDCCAQGAIAKGKFHRSSGRVDAMAILAVADDVSSGMTFLHSHGILHGNLSAASVLLAHSQVRPYVPMNGSMHRSRQITDTHLRRMPQSGSKDAWIHVPRASVAFHVTHKSACCVRQVGKAGACLRLISWIDKHGTALAEGWLCGLCRRRRTASRPRCRTGGCCGSWTRADLPASRSTPPSTTSLLRSSSRAPCPR